MKRATERKEDTVWERRKGGYGARVGEGKSVESRKKYPRKRKENQRRGNVKEREAEMEISM